MPLAVMSFVRFYRPIADHLSLSLYVPTSWNIDEMGARQVYCPEFAREKPQQPAGSDAAVSASAYRETS
jgi:hypothetical protein